MTEIARQLERKEFKVEGYKQRAIYLRYIDQIVVSTVFGDNDYLTLIVYKDGTFDFKHKKEQLKKGSKNPLVGRYNYESIMNSIENKRKSDLQNLKYIVNLIYVFSKLVGGVYL